MKDAIPKIDANERRIQAVIFQAKINAARAVGKLDALGIGVAERHNVLVPGTPTDRDESMRILSEEITKKGKTTVYLGDDICAYHCLFCRYDTRVGTEEDANKAANSIILEMPIVSEKLQLKVKPKASSVYYGGGTPTIMSGDYMEKLDESLRKYFDVDDDAEITMETTPDTLTPAKIEAMRGIGVNRISMGIQRLDDAWLKSVNRKHSVQDVFDALELLRDSGIKFNVDFMYGFEGQTMESYCRDVMKILEFEPHEVTTYRLEVETRTADRPIPRVQRAERGLTYAMQEAGRIILEDAGYAEGPDGWFTRPGVERNAVYRDRWDEDEQIPLVGFGPEAYSFSERQQHTNFPFKAYTPVVDSNSLAVDGGRTYKYDDDQREIHRMVFALKSRFQTRYDAKHEAYFASLVNHRLGDIILDGTDEIFILNGDGLIVVEEIMRVLVDESAEIGRQN